MILADLSPDAYREATEYLAALDPDWSRHIAATGPCPVSYTHLTLPTIYSV